MSITRLFVVVLLVLAFSASSPSSAASADSQDRIAATLEKNGIVAGALGLRPPVPQLVFTDSIGDLQPLPPQWKIEDRAVMDIVQLEAKSNGVDTIMVVRFSPKSTMDRIAGSIMLDTDANRLTGFDPVLFIEGSEHRPGMGADVEVSLWNFPRSRTALVHSRFRRMEIPVGIEGSTLKFTIPNEILETLGKGEASVFAHFGDEFGLQDFGPNRGVGLITSTGRLRVSPGSSVLVRDLGRDPKFNFTAVIDQDDPGLDTARLWLENGNSITATIEANLTHALLIPGKGKRAGKVFSFPYPINSLTPGRHEMTVIAISAETLMVDEVVYDVVEQISPPPLPGPPR